MKAFWTATALAVCLAGCSTVPNEANTLPAVSGQTSEEARIADLLSRMSIERKVAQLVQPQINSFTAEDMRRYRFGSYLNGGNGGPYGDEFAEASEWLKLADEMYLASVEPLEGNEPVIPMMWGTDAVHGHTNVIRATIFPHNIGLGATRDADLVRRIGEATATEIAVTGIDWNFSPTVAVARDDRWGRTYESYSEDPAIVAPLGAALIEGLQGRQGDPDRLRGQHVIATAKHFFGDGGTDQGVDQGEVTGDIESLKAIHAAPYPAAIDAGVEAVMASFNSINGRKMHGNEALLTGVLRDELGFDGLVVGDWNGHGQVAGCTNTDCPQSLLAGLDIYMVPDEWRGLLETTVAQVRDGTIPMARLDEAVGRVLRVKMRAGLLDEFVRPSQRPVAGRYDLLGSAEHRAIAREAVAKSQVLLKNNGVLPLKAGATVLVAGSAADDIAQAAGGWTLTWQGGGDLDNEYFPGATSIWQGLKAATEESGGTAMLAPDGDYTTRPDVAIVVFGEEPYAEFAGDRKNVAFSDEEGLALLRRFEAEDIPTVAVFLSGRPMWVNRELNAADAFVAAWLPGSEGAGIADVLTGTEPSTGRLSFSWPRGCDAGPVNGPEKALFPVGYGLSLTQRSSLPMLDESCDALLAASGSDWFVNGRFEQGITAVAGGVALPDLRGAGGGVTARGIDRNAQEDSREITFTPGSALTISQTEEGEGAYRIVYRVRQRPQQTVTLTTGSATLSLTQPLSVAAEKDWREMVITEECASGLGNELTIASEGAFTLDIATIERDNLPEGTACSF
ncbi:glycoside hydrolase family 3 protein [Altererythrobacter aurantiacus]|uniref:Glycoside hydrolase family 3 protein n=1 Tax=Parapontixanthobacter aurantiacus TaxID=1463599 RepID=A0A844ZH69_9SPHN|nr:glycoside hydrolase family 3 protein [Parapontixanthobacter aurantiacus]MXO85069.1 glycoside hydrolase family 3 protein [Parapontixanthobacter aurantiacus]